MKLFSSHCCGKLSKTAWFALKTEVLAQDFSCKSYEGKYNFGPVNEAAACAVMLPVCPPDGINVSQMRRAQPQDFKSKTLP